MYIIFFFASFVFFVTFFVILASKMIPDKKTKKKSLSGVAIASLISFVLFVVLAPATPPQESAPLKESLPSSTEQEIQTTDFESKQSEVLSAQTNSKNNLTNAEVIKIIDGDTVLVTYLGKNETIRMIGIDTPETVDPRKDVQCFGKEASNKTSELISGKKVIIETDESQGERDKYGRLLAYIKLEDGTNVNKLLIAEGFAYEYTYQNNPYKYQSEFIQAQLEAKQKNNGLWSENACKGFNSVPTNPTPTKSMATPKKPSNTSNSTQNNLSGDKDCKDFSTHSQAQSYFNAKGGSPSNNIDNLDADHDGVACESLP